MHKSADKFYFFLILFLFTAFLGVMLCSCSKEKSQNANEEICDANLYNPEFNERIVAFGDSITAGYNQTSCPESYAYFLAAATGKVFVNSAIDGSISDRQLQEVMVTNILPSDIVVMIAGYNDSLFYGLDSIGMQIYENNLNQMLNRFSVAKKILIGDGFTNLPVGYKDHSFPNGSDEVSLAYSDLTRKIIKESMLHNVVVVPTMNALDHNPAYYVRDQIHPNKIGQAVLAGLFLKYLKD